MRLTGVHHVSGLTAEAPKNLDYTRTLGLRLVKKTANQDDTAAHHLFYGDERGQAGTIFEVALRVRAVNCWGGAVAERNAPLERGAASVVQKSKVPIGCAPRAPSSR